MSGKKSKGRKSSGRKTAQKSSSISFRRFLTILLWPGAIAGIILFFAWQAKKQHEARLDSEIEQIEQQYESEIAELELQVDLLEKQLQFESVQKQSQ